MRVSILTEDKDLALRYRKAMAEAYGGARLTVGYAETTDWGIAEDYCIESYIDDLHPVLIGSIVLAHWGDSTEDSVAYTVDNTILFVDNPTKGTA